MGSDADPHRTLRERYRLLAEIGRGGMGRVWRAHDIRLNRAVAVKEIFLAPGQDETERGRTAARARREAQAAAMGGHPNIVTVHDIVEDDGRPWIVMEFLTGRSLHALVRDDGPRDHREAAAWGLDLLSALTTAHGQGITHRDVKPENVMVTDSGRVVLTDFGIATIADTASVTQTAGVLGSPAYLAPERLGTGPASPASDLWSLGATLYHTATGISPFRREGIPATLHAVTSVEPPDVLGRGPLGQAVRGLLVKDPARRIDADRCRELLSAEAVGAVVGTGFTASPALTSSSAGPAPSGPLPAPARAPLPTGFGTAPQASPAAFAPPPAQPTRPVAPPHGPPPGPTVPMARAPRSGGRLSWPFVVLTLGLSALVAAASLLVALDPWGGEPDPTAAASGEEQGSAADGGAADATGGPSEQEGDGEPEAVGGESVTGNGTTWTEEDQGFGIGVPDGWIRRTAGTSVFYDSPHDGSYLQVDMAEHPTDDEYQHVAGLEQGVQESGRMPGYERVRLEDATAGSGFHSVAEWEFTWNGDGQERRLLSRNIAVAPGVHYTVAWVTPAASWNDQADLRAESLDSFEPS
ncbi:serine/threonine-protein kinase [Nocardiopsis tropica]|uniref:non-specific serine/threonine protein kinase n=1 Tax=Nocardiopsis tropica TaxID=109330 RepID=A0ABV1ZQC7_9ACTN